MQNFNLFDHVYTLALQHFIWHISYLASFVRNSNAILTKITIWIFIHKKNQTLRISLKTMFVCCSVHTSYHLFNLEKFIRRRINFSVNFVLYYVIIAPFRLTLHEYLRSSIRTICRMKKESRSSDRVDKEPQTEMLLFRKENHHRHPSSFS